MKIFILLFLSFLIFACGNNNLNNKQEDGKDETKGLRVKKIAPGFDLKFECPDSVNNRTVKLAAVWKSDDEQWLIEFTEINTSNLNLIESKGLIGQPDEVQTLKMNIFSSEQIYAVMTQVNSGESLYKDGNRNLNCKF